jgi:hypothetical protein
LADGVDIFLPWESFAAQKEDIFSSAVFPLFTLIFTYLFLPFSSRVAEYGRWNLDYDNNTT